MDIKAKITIETDAARAKTELGAVAQASKSAFDTVDRSAKTAATAMSTFNSACHTASGGIRDLVVGLGGLQVLQSTVGSLRSAAQSALDTASGFERANIMLTRLTGSAEGGRAAFGWLMDFSAANPVMELKAYQDAFIKLQTSGMKPMEGTLQTLTDSVAAFGGGSQELERASVAIQQMSGKGVISMEELRQQLGEVLPTAMKTMADEMGLTVSQLGKQVEQGAVSAVTGLSALFTGLKKQYGGAAGDMAGTWQGVTGAMATDWAKFEAELMSAGAFDALKGHVKELSSGINEAMDDGSARKFAETLTTGVRAATTALSVLETAAGFTVQHFTGLATLMAGGIWAKYALGIGAAERAMLTWGAAADTALVSQITLWNKLTGLQAIRAPLGEWITALGAINTLALGIGAAVAGWQIGSFIEEKADPWGFHALEAAMRDAEKGLASAESMRSQRLSKLGFTGEDAMERFKDAVESGKMVYDAAAGGYITTKAKEKQATDNTAKAVETATKGLEAYAKAMSGYGSEYEKAMSRRFSDALKDTNLSPPSPSGEGWGEVGRGEVSAMRAPLDEYLRALDDVYSARKRIEQGAMDALVMSDAPRAALAGQQKLMLEIDQNGAQARLTAWEQYYSRLEAMHKQAVDAQIEKTKELAELEKNIRQQREGYGDLELGLRQKLMSPLEQYYSTQDSLEQKYRAAMAMSGQERIDALVKFQQAAASAAQEITDGDWMLTLEQTVTHALGQVSGAQAEIAAEQERLTAAKQDEITAWADWQTAVETAMGKADEMMGHYRDRIIDIDNLLRNLDTQITITLNDQVSAALGTLHTRIQGMGAYSLSTQSIPSTESTSAPAEPDYEYATGSRYIESDRVALIHKGEAVVPAAHNIYKNYSFAEVSRAASAEFNSVGANGRSPMPITLGDINITVSSLPSPSGEGPGVRSSGEGRGEVSIDIDGISREVARQLRDKLQRRFN